MYKTSCLYPIHYVYGGWLTVLHVRVPQKVADRLDAQASRELRSRNNMAAVIITEGVSERWSRNPPALLPLDEGVS